MLLNAITNSIQNAYLMDTTNISNLIYDYVDTEPRCFLVHTDTSTTRDFYTLDRYEFISLPNENQQLFQDYMEKLQQTLLKSRGYSNTFMPKGTLVIDRVVVDGKKKEFIFICYEDNQLWPVFSFYSIDYKYNIDFFLKYKELLNNRFIVTHYTYKNQFDNNMSIDKYNRAYTYIYDNSYIWNKEKPTKVCLKISLTIDKEWLVNDVYPLFSKQLDLDRVYTGHLFNTTATLRNCLFHKYRHPQLQTIVFKSMGFSNDVLYLYFDTLW